MSETMSTAAASQSASPPSEPRKTLAIARLRDLALAPAIIAVAIVGFVVNPVFLQSDNIINVLQSRGTMPTVPAGAVLLCDGRFVLALAGRALGDPLRVLGHWLDTFGAGPRPAPVLATDRGAMMADDL